MGATPNPPGTRPDPQQPEGTDLMPRVQHIVVLMMENHSYDNYFGMLERGDGLLLDKDGKPTPTNPASDGTLVGSYHLPTTSQKDNKVTQSWAASHRQYDDGKLDGFVVTSGSPAMGYWNAADLPFYYSLARTFPLCDRYFGSVLAQT
ncbi:MAG TPA: alkaline phosphatase family protein, partial [Pseudomonadota bacterium]|nr:alkaline phosphatase family protein [Pseudomonadota bacterium]